MNSEQYKNWLDTSSRLFSNNYSINNAILVFMQKQDASYTMGYEQWKEYGRNVKQGAKGIKILIPVMAYEKNQGALFKMIKNNLNSQLAKNSSLNVASYRIGKTSLEFTMNREETWGMKVNGKYLTMNRKYRNLSRNLFWEKYQCIIPWEQYLM